MELEVARVDVGVHGGGQVRADGQFRAGQLVAAQPGGCDQLGGDYFAKHDLERALRRITRQANALGLTVRFEPVEAT